MWKLSQNSETFVPVSDFFWQENRQPNILLLYIGLDNLV